MIGTEIQRWSELADLAEQYEAIVKREENANRPC
jgi:hypothetical protein